MTDTVIYAPEEAIKELDNLIEYFDLLSYMDLIGEIKAELMRKKHASSLYNFVLKSEANQKAVITHIIGNERLLPEREPRYVVEVGEGAHRHLLTKFKGMYRSTIIEITEDHVNYGKDTHTLSLEEAKHIQAVVGGEAKEIK